MYIVVDFEATCCNYNSFPRHEMEIIEFGAVLLNEGFGIIDEFQAFVKPVKNPKLTKFCKELTTIKQSDVNNARIFREVYREFYDWLNGHNATLSLLCSWGDFDVNILQKNCKMNDVQYWNCNHLNIKNLFSSVRNTKRCGVAKALQMTRERLDGTHHRAIDDARNIAKLLPYALKAK